MDVILDTSMLATVLGKIKKHEMAGEYIERISLTEEEMVLLIVNLKETSSKNEDISLDEIKAGKVIVLNEIPIGIGEPRTLN